MVFCPKGTKNVKLHGVQHCVDASREGKREALAVELMTHARASLLMHLRYMGIAIGRLDLTPQPGLPMATNGERVFFDPDHVLDIYRAEPEALTRDLLHGVLHCVFSHLFVDEAIDRMRWSLACDMAVEHAINGLGGGLTARRQGAQAGILAALPERVRPYTAEKIYRWLLSSEADPLALQEAFYADNHSLWYAETEGFQSMSEGGDSEMRRPRDKQQRAQEWKRVGEQIEVDAETASHRQEGGAGYVVQNLRPVTRRRYDYEAFLRRFAVLEEEMRESPDEFDYNFYTYGLRLYQNMPLIEPLEYREAYKIKDFVVVIDTSGSVSGEQVQRFVQKTYDLLRQSESFGRRVHLRILQCDAQVQEDTAIDSPEALEEYLSTLRLKGFGGTDFRPAFRHVEALIEKGELTSLRGLIYFTDGFGLFPEVRTRFETAFVFVTDTPEDIPPVPVWAIRLVLPPDEI